MQQSQVVLLAILALSVPLASSAHPADFATGAALPQLVQLFKSDSTGGQSPIEPVQELRRYAEQGDPNAQYKLGLVYDAGVGAQQDLAQAALWYQRAADQGHVAAQFSLGLMYSNGRGVPQDLVQAHIWLNIAAAGSQAAARTERDLVAAKMTRSQIAQAVRLAREWQPKADLAQAPRNPGSPASGPNF
jgi:TPR repeat protein